LSSSDARNNCDGSQTDSLLWRSLTKGNFMERIKTDVAVLGTGAAGMSEAITA